MIQFPDKIKITISIITAQKPSVLSKQFTLADDGTLQKQPGGVLVEGTATRRTLSVTEFSALLAELKPSQALTFGVCQHDLARVVPQKNISKATGKLPIIARDREHFTWPDGPGVLMIDFDPLPDGKPFTREQLLSALYGVWLELRDAPHVWTVSASSCIYRTDSDLELRGVMGQRVYVPILSSQDVPRTGATLVKRLWLAGFGRYDVSKSGAMLERSLVDASVWQPERLDFAGGAHCGPVLEQRRGVPTLFNAEAPFIDSRTLAELTPEEQVQLDLLREAARLAKQPACQEQQKVWIDDRVKAMLQGENAKEKEAVLRDLLTRAVTQKRLYGDFQLVSEKHGTLTVGQLLDNPDKYHNTRFADPLEPDYSGGDHRIAWAHLRTAAKPYIWSHAHGGNRFTLHRAVQVVQIQGGELQNLTAKCLELMRLDGIVYAREGELARLSDGKAFPVSPEWLAWYLTGLLQFQKFDKRSEEWRIVDCPASLARTICALSGQWTLPTLEAVLTAPSITPDGRLIQTDGFDQQTGLYLHFPASHEWKGVPEQPGEQEIKAAVVVLWKAFEKFPFVTPVDRGGYLAALLTAVTRSLLPTAPGFLISAPVAGTGKTLLALCLAALGGVTASVTSAGRDEAEIGKTLLTELRAFSRCIVFDNLARPLESESLCAFLSTPCYSGRLLGLNKNIAGRPVAMVILTGNNPTILGDLNRRLIRITVDPQLERPDARRFNMNPLSYVETHRLELVHAALVILKGALASGFKHDGGGMASFDVWSFFVRHAVCWVGQNGWLDVGDPVRSIDLSFELDPETTRLKALQNEWKRVFGKSGGSVAQAIRRAKDDGTLFDILNEISGEKGNIPPRRLGNWITRREGRIVDGCCFARCGSYQNGVVWFVQSREFGEFQSSFTPTCENWQGDNYMYQGKIAPQTHETHQCDLCVNFSHNASDPQNGPGTCETPHDGHHSKTPIDGAGCERFEQITH